jgi:low affinity Fe/Cu permease
MLEHAVVHFRLAVHGRNIGHMKERFRRLSARLTYALGSPWSVILAVTLISLWLVGGLMGGFSELWLLLINTVSTIVTFVMVFVIQGSTNRSDRAIQLKLDALIAHLEQVPSEIVGAEDEPEARVAELTEQVKQRVRG